MGALRRDGTVTFYQIEMFEPARPNYRDYDEWILCHQPGEDWREKYSFSANGDVWQQAGHHGTFDRDWGFRAMLRHADLPDNRGNIYRLVERTISMKTVEIGKVCIQQPKEVKDENYEVEAS
jgi:hypothetical protein